MNYSLKELRARKELTQEEVAKILGISTATYIRIEAKPRKCKVDVFSRLADLFEVDMKEIKL